MPNRVSVIIPAYNSAKTIRACLEAVYRQRQPIDEVLVVDDASTDATREIVREFPCRLIESGANAGPAAARNRGILASRGDILFFVDSDCAPEPDALPNALRLMTSEPDVACVHGIYAVAPLFDDGPVEAYRLLHGHYWRLRNVGRVRTTLFAVCAIRRSVFADVGLFDESLRASEDVELGDRMDARDGIVLTDTVVCRHDDDDRLRPMLRKQFSRSQMLVPVALAERGPAGLRANRPAALVLAGLAPLTLPLAVLNPALLALPPLLAVAFVAADPGLLRFVARRRGMLFVVYFYGVHLLMQWTIAAGAVTGGLRYLRRRDVGPARPAPAGRPR